MSFEQRDHALHIAVVLTLVLGQCGSEGEKQYAAIAVSGQCEGATKSRCLDKWRYEYCYDEDTQVVVRCGEGTRCAEEQGEADCIADAQDGAPASNLTDGGMGDEEEDQTEPPSPPPGCGASECPELKIFRCDSDEQTPLICGPRMGEPEDCVSVWQDLGSVCPPGTVCTVSGDQRSFECVVEGVAPVCIQCGADSDCPLMAPRCLVWTTNTAISWCSGPCGSSVDCPPASTCFSSPEILSVCIPTWRRDCQDGDVWEVDSCGNAIRLVEECGPSSCVGGAC